MLRHIEWIGQVDMMDQLISSAGDEKLPGQNLGIPLAPDDCRPMPWISGLRSG